MHTRDLSKSQRRKIRELAALAHDRELSVELSKLEEAFRRWRSGDLDPHQLNDVIHAFHQGPSRKLFSQYTDAASTLPIAAAIVRGIVAETEVPEDVLAVLHADIALLRDEHDANREI